MTPLSPLKNTASTEAERVVANAASVEPRAIDGASWDELVARAALQPSSSARLIPAFVLAVAAGIAIVLVVSRRAPVPPQPAAPQLVATSATRWKLSSPSTVVLSEGKLSMTRAGETPVRIETPHAVLEVNRSRFLAEVVATGTSISVEEGEVVLRSGSNTRVVRAGQSLIWPPAPLIPPTLLEVTQSAEARCAATPAGERRGCLEAEAATSSLDAQAALYELGVLEAKSGRSERAVEAWRQSLRRFPGGVLHPEVRLALLVELVHARRFAEAELVAGEFETACAGDPRRSEVASLRELLAR